MARVPAGLPGARPPRAIAGPRDAWLIVADVPLDAYGEATINANLNDLDWVGARAMAHESVVHHFARRFDVAPMKLFTIFRNDARAIADVAGSADLSTILKRIGGCAEWSVRVTRRRAPQAAPTKGRRLRGQPEASGTGFLLRKKDERAESRGAAAESRRIAEDAYRALCRVARDSVRKDGDVPNTNLLLDAAFLVSKARQKSFVASATKLARLAAPSGCELSLSGPWPAYHFVTRG